MKSWASTTLGDAKHLAHLLKYDSVHGKFPGDVTTDGENLIVNGIHIPVSKIRSPKDLPWGKLEVAIAAECTGLFTSRTHDKGGFGDHLTAGAKKVLLSAPSKEGVDATIVFGVNEKTLKAEQPHLLQRQLHDQLHGAGDESVARQFQDRQRLRDHDSRLHE